MRSHFRAACHRPDHKNRSHQVSIMAQPDMPRGAWRILIVEDFPIVALGMKSMLEDLGVEVVEIATSGSDAVMAADRHRPDLVFMDIDLGEGMDGIEAAIAIRDAFGIPTAFLTGYSTSVVKERAAAADPVATLDKTSSRATIAELLSSLSA